MWKQKSRQKKKRRKVREKPLIKEDACEAGRAVGRGCRQGPLTRGLACSAGVPRRGEGRGQAGGVGGRCQAACPQPRSGTAAPGTAGRPPLPFPAALREPGAPRLGRRFGNPAAGTKSRRRILAKLPPPPSRPRASRGAARAPRAAPETHPSSEPAPRGSPASHAACVAV